MKRFLHWSVVPALGVLALGIVAIVGSALHPRTKHEPCIVFLLQHDTGVGATTFPLDEGFNRRNIWTETDAGITNNFDESETVVGVGENKLAIKVHCLVKRNGVASDLEETIPVLNHKPENPVWNKLNSHVAACAYLDVATNN